MTKDNPFSPVPVQPMHPYSAIVIILLDNTVAAIELINPLAIVVTCIGLGVLTSFVVAMLELYMAGENWGIALSKGCVAGVMTGVPFSVAGTVFGGLLLAWAGLNKYVQLSAMLNKPQSLS